MLFVMLSFVVIASDFGEELTHNTEQKNFATSCSKNSFSCVRNVFIVERPNIEDCNKRLDFQNDVLHIGQKFLLKVHPDYDRNPYYLASHIITPQICSRYSREQLVFISNVRSYHAGM
jgi:hypothetical protein